MVIREIRCKKRTEERAAVKKAAHDLLTNLKDGLLTLDWRKHQRSQAQVRIAIEDLLDATLPDAFTTDLYEEKCELVYQHIYENYFGDGRSTYASMPLVV